MIAFILASLALGATTLFLMAGRRSAPEAAPAARPSRGLVLAIAALLVVVAGGGYAVVGSPGLLPITPDAPPGPGPAADAQLAALQARAQKNPSDASAWVAAGRAQLELDHADVAAQDYRRAVELRPKDADLLADLADVLAVSTHGRLDGEPIQFVERALAADPNHVKALALKGSYLMTQRDFRGALESWDHAMRVAQPGDPIAAFLRQQIEQMRAAALRAAAAASAPGAASAPR